MLLLAVSAALRLAYIDRESIWLDEAITLRQADPPMAKTIEYISHDSHFPLYVVLMHFWVRAFGDSAVAARMLSLLFGVASVLMIFILGRKIFSEKVGLISAAIFTFSSYMIYYSQEARLYTLLIFLTMLSYYAYIRMIEDDSPKNVIFYVIATVLMVYTHMFALITFFCQGTYYLYLKRKSIDKIKKAILVMGTITVIFLPWFFVLVRQIGFNNLVSWIPRTTAESVFITAYTIMNGLPLLVIFSVLVIFAAILWKKEFSMDERKDFMMLIYFTIIPFMILIVMSIALRPLIVPKYLLFLSGYMAISSAFLIDRIPKKNWVKYVIIAVVIVSSLVITVIEYNSLEKQDWRNVAAYLKEHREDGDMILIQPYYFTDPFAYYYDRECFFVSDLNYCLSKRDHVASLSYDTECCSATTRMVSADGRDNLRDYDEDMIWLVMPEKGTDSGSDIMFGYITQRHTLENNITFAKEITIYKFSR